MSTLPSRRPLAPLLACCLVACGAARARGDGFETGVKPLVARYCLDCHSGAEPGGGVDLGRYASAADVAADPEPWRLAADQLRAGAMPPEDAPQPAPEEREALRAALREELLAVARARGDDPGPVVLRRLSNFEYTASLRDLTGVASLDPARDLPADGAAGEGFTNVGQALLMSPLMVEKYLDAAKEVAAHAVLTPDGIGYSPSTTRRDWTEERLAAIRAIYARTTENSGGTAVNLQGIAFDTNAGGRLPLVPCLKASLEEREGLLAGSVTPAEAAARHGVSPRYLAALVAALVDEAPCLPLDAVRAEWRQAGPEDAERLAGLIRPWQESLWAFNTIGHIGKRDGPKAWQTPVVPLAERHEIRLRLPKDAAGPTIPVWFAAGGVGGGAASDVALFEAPRIVAAGRPDLPLADLRGTVAALAARRARLVDDTAEVLALAATVEGPLDDAGLAALATTHGLEPAVVSAWLRWLGTGRGGARLEGHIEGRMEAHADHPFVKGWTGAEALSVIANPSTETVRVPGTMGPKSLAVHPTPTRRVVLAWKSPISGVVTVRGTVQHAHPACGNGVTWGVEARRGGSVVRLAAGRAQGDATTALGPFADLAVRQGDLVVLWVGPGGRDHSCDLTAVDVVIEQPAAAGGAARQWSLSGDVVPDILAGNPHADGRGRAGVWHFAHEPDQPTGALAIPPGSLVDRWLTAPSGAERAAAAADLERLLAAALAGHPPTGPDGALASLLLSPTGPVLAPSFRAWLAAPAPADAAGAFGRHPAGLAVGPADLCLAAPGRITVEIPADLAAGSELVTAATLHSQSPPTASVQPALHVGPAPEPVPGLNAGRTVVAAPGSPAARRIEEGFAAFRELFPTAPCYVKIVPVDEVVTLNVFFREDDHLRRLLLDAEQTARLDRAWEELEYVSREPLELRDALEQLIEYATQDNPAGVQSFTPMRPHVVARAEAFTARLVATEPAHLDAVVARAGQAFRRPLTAAEEERLRGLYRRLRAESHPHEEAIRLTLASVLVAPEFLYKLESPGPGSTAAPVTPHELATRLSLFLWSSLPDEELLALAASGALADDAGLVAQTRRMLADPRARRLAEEFGTQWLHVHGFATHDEKSADVFPSFAALRAAMAEETVLFLDDLFRNDRPIDSLVNADHTFLDADLAAHYGIPGIEGSHWRRVDGVQPFGRGGILGLGSTLATTSGASRTSPILRGNWLSEVILGEKLPKPPKNVPLLADEVPAGLSERELIARHSADESCATCHRRIDPYGFALEGFDAIGRRRTLDAAGHPIDDRTTLPDGTAVAGVDGLRDWLGGRRGRDVERQFCRKMLGYALGRGVQLSDEPLLDTIQERLATADHRVGVAIEAIVTSPQFRSIRGRDAADEP